MTFSRNFAIYLQLCGLAFLPTIRAQDSYTEASFPQPLLLKPGITQISGGVTTADQADAFHYRTSHPGNVTVRLRYQHRNANFALGISELPHLSGNLDFGYYIPSLPFISSNLAPPATLSSPFYLTNGANAISATVPAVTEFDATARLRVSAPAGKTHPDYTVEIDYQPVLDPWEAGSGNESAPTALSSMPALQAVSLAALTVRPTLTGSASPFQPAVRFNCKSPARCYPFLGEYCPTSVSSTTPLPFHFRRATQGTLALSKTPAPRPRPTCFVLPHRMAMLRNGK